MKKRSSEKTRHVVAWINKAEWDQVLEYMYSKDCTLQRYALHRVSAWKARYAGRTPVAVECTADLVRCQVMDKSGKLGGDDLVLLYGTALVRFVNLITERRQGRVARPLRRLAGGLNIPEWIVNLRHDFTHRKLPTLNWCRKGCQVVLTWLQQEYWSRQLGGGANENWNLEAEGEDEEEELKRHDEELVARQKEMECYTSARELLISFTKEQYQCFDSLPRDDQKPPWLAPSEDLSWILAQIKDFARESCETLFDVLVEDGFLVPTVAQLESLDCDAFDRDCAGATVQLPQTFLHFWLPLLKTFNSAFFIHLLLEKLFLELKELSKEPNNHRTFYVSAWISEVIACNINRHEHHFETKVQRKTRVRDKIFVNRIQLRWQQLLSACLDAPCFSTPHLLQLILDDMEHPLPSETRQNLLKLCTIYTQSAHADVEPHPEQRHQPIYTLESLHEKLRLAPRRHRAESESSDQIDVDLEAEKAKLLKGSPWQVCTDKVQWKNFPLGKVPGQSEDPSSLVADNYSTMVVLEQPVELEATALPKAGGTSASLRTTEGLLWTHSDVTKLKSGLQLF